MMGRGGGDKVTQRGRGTIWSKAELKKDRVLLRRKGEGENTRVGWTDVVYGEKCSVGGQRGSRYEASGTPAARVTFPSTAVSRDAGRGGRGHKTDEDNI